MNRCEWCRDSERDYPFPGSLWCSALETVVQPEDAEECPGYSPRHAAEHGQDEKRASNGK